MHKPILLAAGLVVFVAAHAQDVVTRGRHLAAGGDCTGCDASAGGSGDAGGQPLTAAFGSVYSSDITPDRQTGIGGWTQQQIYQARRITIGPLIKLM